MKLIILSLKKKNLSMISHFLIGLTFLIIIQMLALNLMFFMNDQISQFINCHAPCRKLSKHEIKLSTKAWITKDILAKIRYRHKLYSQIMKSKQPDPNLIYLHKKFRNSVVKHIKASKSYYLKNYFLCNRNNVKKNLVRNQIDHKYQ